MKFLPLTDWGFPMKPMFLGAGPCGAESRQQILDTARELRGAGISFLRAGLWKPRTHPGTFEGVGEAGISWLLEAREQYGMRVAVEVAHPEHVALCRENGVDIVWIGARTTSSPFAVQSLADALRETGLPVFVKNPLSPDIELWIGAIERIANAGVQRLGAIHRGFRTARSAPYRFSPMWRIPIELRRRFKDLPILCDPSHLCGRTDLIFNIAQEALDLLYDGLMIEVHIAPHEAQSDAAQQLTPQEFREMLNRLTLRRASVKSDAVLARLRLLRAEVDDLDQDLIELIGRRMAVVREMGGHKRVHGIPALQPARWEEIIKSRVAAGRAEGLDGEFLFRLLELIHEEAIRQQERVLQNPPREE